MGASLVRDVETVEAKHARWDGYDADWQRIKAHPLWQAFKDASADGHVEPGNRARWRVRVRDLQNGHKEALAIKVVPDPLRDVERAIRADLGLLAKARGEGEVEANAASNGRRAKRDVRLYCKLLGVSSLWTLTYRANQTCRKLARKHLTAFVRRVRVVLPDFRYVAVPEKQGRGAIHWHIATHGLPRTFTVKGTRVKSWNVLRAIWRSVVGAWGGTFNESKGVGKWRREGRDVRSGAIGRYISKYIAKGFEETELNAHRFSRSEGLDIPAGERHELAGDMALREVMECCYAAVGERITGAYLDTEAGVFFVETDDSQAGPS